MSIFRHKGHLWLSRPKWLFGLGLRNIPAVPFDLSDILDSGFKLLDRRRQIKRAKNELTNEYTINGRTATGREFMFGPGILGVMEPDDVDKALQALVGALHGSPWQLLRRFSREFRQREDDFARAIGVRGPEYLDEPKQFSMAWTNHWNVYQQAKDKNLDDKWASSLTDVEEANSQFWPMIAIHGMAYNLLILQKVDAANKSRWERMFPHGWPTVLEEAFAAGNLYVIDLSLFENVKPHHVDGADRFTPSTTTWLVQNPDTKALTPVAIRVSGYANQGNKFYQPSDPAWLYALQAAKTSITVYGIWIGHVYHYHVVTAAMQMTMYNTLPEDHAIYQLLAPQSKYVIPFDDILLLLWRPIGPPTSISTPVQFLRLADLFAGGRSFFDDDPKTTLSNFGIRKEDFTAKEAWDQYPIVGQFLEIWDATEKYVSVFVDETYADDQRVAVDPALRSWMQASASRRKGNIRGLPPMDGKTALKKVLTSILYRITVHGVARLNPALNPAETFMSNYPPCLQKKTIPDPDTAISTRELLEYLPNTDTLGKMVNFYYIFVFSRPYERFLPEGGNDKNLFFAGGENEPRNAALIAYRDEIAAFAQRYDPRSPQLKQWPLNVET